MVWVEQFHLIVSLQRWKEANGNHSGKDWTRRTERNSIKCFLIHGCITLLLVMHAGLNWYILSWCLYYLKHRKQLEILRKSVADKYLIIQRADFSCSFRCCTSIKTSDLSGSLSWLLTLFIQFSRLFALLYRYRNLFLIY